MTGAQINTEKLKSLIEEAKASGGVERANYQIFVNQFCAVFGLEAPAYSKDDDADNNYVFERRIKFNHPDGTSTPGWIDCYKRGAFILEAKQSKKRQRKTEDKHKDQLSFLPEDKSAKKRDVPKRGWDQIMLSARRQAEDYAKALPVDHGYPPFLLIVDVGHVIEVYADFSGPGKNYAHFPDRQNYRITMDDLLNDKVQQRLTNIWQDPTSLDPTRISAIVTKDVAERLAKIAATLERNHDAKDVAEFLMRCLFTMFAEDAGLIPDKGFEKLLEQLKDAPQNFVPALESLWKTMNEGGYEPHLFSKIKRFNGGLFAECRALPLERDQINELYIASKRDWKDVEPAIFGTLLERALDYLERSKLGAHYTPRNYVERLVIPTIIEPLRADWQEVQDYATELQLNGDADGALKVIKAFHHKLCTTRVLDPACGSGNFLYVSLELMKRLEGDVLEALNAFGEEQVRFAMEGETVSPRQFYGLELNPRAVPIADLVLWLGYLKWQLRTAGLQSITEPVLHAYGTIKQQDSILKYDKQEVLKDEKGRPLSRWDGVTKKLHPITGEEIPDPDAQMPLCKYVNPRPAQWPEVEFIVGNPPFIGGKDMRQELGDGYAESCWAVRPHIPGGADFVMHFWDQAAEILLRKGLKTKPNPLRRFGFITTNSITQTFSRRVIEHRMKGKESLSLVYAVPDHPWLKASDKAAVRIAMTVSEKGLRQGVMAEVLSETGLNTDTPLVELKSQLGEIDSNLSVGAKLTSVNELKSNQFIAFQGFKPYGAGFIITAAQADAMIKRSATLSEYIRPYLNGRDVAQHSRNVFAVDFHGLSLDAVRTRYPEVYQHMLQSVKPERDHVKMEYRRKNWWLFGQPSTETRNAIQQISSFLITPETAKHRYFLKLKKGTLPDQKLRLVAIDSYNTLSILSSRLHVRYAESQGNWQGIGNDPVYTHNSCFNTFSFPVISENHALQDCLRELGERLDSFRKERLATHGFLTMTGLYNALERLREIENGCAVEPLSAAERDVHEAGLISVLKEIHDDIDRAVLSAYGWNDLAPRPCRKARWHGAF